MEINEVRNATLRNVSTNSCQKTACALQRTRHIPINHFVRHAEVRVLMCMMLQAQEEQLLDSFSPAFSASSWTVCMVVYLL